MASSIKGVGRWFARGKDDDRSWYVTPKKRDSFAARRRRSLKVSGSGRVLCGTSGLVVVVGGDLHSGAGLVMSAIDIGGSDAFDVVGSRGGTDVGDNILEIGDIESLSSLRIGDRSSSLMM